MRIAVFSLVAAAWAGCAARPVSGMTTIPRDTPASCSSICENLGLKLGAVVVIANEVGCVCQKPAADASAGAAAVAAGIYVALWRADDRREPAWVPGF